MVQVKRTIKIITEQSIMSVTTFFFLPSLRAPTLHVRSTALLLTKNLSNGSPPPLGRLVKRCVTLTSHLSMRDMQLTTGHCASQRRRRQWRRRLPTPPLVHESRRGECRHQARCGSGDVRQSRLQSAPLVRNQSQAKSVTSFSGCTQTGPMSAATHLERRADLPPRLNTDWQ
jgi:hypothetical protein